MAATKGGPWCRARCCFEAGPPPTVRVCLTRRGPRHGSAANAAPGAGQRRCCRLAPIAAVFQVSDGLQAAVAGALRGMGRQRLVAGLNLVGFWVIGTTVGAPGCHSGESHERESKGARGLIAISLQVAIDFSYLKATLQGVPF